MFATLKKLWVPVLALGLGCAAGVGCVDNSGNKTYPHGDAGPSADASGDSPEGDTPVDAPATDTPASDRPATDAPGDQAHADASPLGDALDALTTDVHPDTAGN